MLINTEYDAYVIKIW